MRSGVVYAEEGIYAGWPANHGAWQWGKEWLVGFLRGKYVRQSMHNIRQPYEYCFARSQDDGLTWSVEPHGREFEAGVVVHSAPQFNIKTSLMRVCGVYDHGGDETDPKGGFFLSENKGKDWHGPYLFSGLEQKFNDQEEHCTSRQAELNGVFFLSNAQRFHWGTDQVFAATYDGARFHVLSDLAFGAGRAVMPAVDTNGKRIVVCARRRGSQRGGGWIDAVYSDDGCKTWSKAVTVGETGSSNGNPPALIYSDKFYCAFGNRSTGTIDVCESVDGVNWSKPSQIARGVKSKSGYFDLGYPRALKRQDGTVVVIYYIATETIPQQHIEWTAL